MESIDRTLNPSPRSHTAAMPWYAPAKRAMDISLSALGLALSMPLLLPAAILIALDSRGPIFHRRLVAGRNGKPFYALKLRTMVIDGDDRIEADEELAGEFQENHKLRDDPRVTRVGAILRKTSIDELPQLINVLRGEMSVVGPRMVSFEELHKFGEWREKILAVKPGITGLWQVSGRSDLDYDERVRLNVYYVEHPTIALDLKILAKTIPAVISGKGAY